MTNRFRGLVIQSHATQVPSWVELCTTSVRSWTKRSGWSHEFVGDEVLERVPEKFGDRFSRELPIVTRTDYGRLKLIEEALLTRRWDCAMWMDADLFIFDLERFAPDPSVLAAPWFATQETWHDLSFAGRHYFQRKINNSILGFSQVDACRTLLRQAADEIARARAIVPTIIGPDLLGQLGQVALLRSVGCFGKRAYREFMRDEAKASRYAKEVRDFQGHDLHAANMCASAEHANERMLAVLERLRGIRGDFAGRPNARRDDPLDYRMTRSHRLLRRLRDFRWRVARVSRALVPAGSKPAVGLGTGVPS